MGDARAGARRDHRRARHRGVDPARGAHGAALARRAARRARAQRRRPRRRRRSERGRAAPPAPRPTSAASTTRSSRPTSRPRSPSSRGSRTARSSCSARAGGRGGPSSSRGSVINRVIRLSGPIDVHVISQDKAEASGARAARAGAAFRRRVGALAAAGGSPGWRSRRSGSPLLTFVARRRRATTSRSRRCCCCSCSLVVAVGRDRRAAARRSRPRSSAFLLRELLLHAAAAHLDDRGAREPARADRVPRGRGVVSALRRRRRRAARCDAAAARADAETLARLAANVQHDDPLADLIVFAPVVVRPRRRERARAATDGGGWRIEAGGRARVRRRRPSDADLTLPLGDGVVLALVGGRPRPATTVRCSTRSPRSSPRARERARLSAAGGARRPQLGAGQRAAHRAAASGVPRPAHAARVDQGVGVEPAPDRRRVVDRGRGRVPRDRSRTRPTASPRSSANLLDMSRLQAGVLQPTLRAGAPRRGRAGRAREPRRARPYGVVVDVPETLPPVRADAALLERVVANLVENAMRVVARRTARCASTAGAVHDRVDLRIIDHGPGIPAARTRAGLPAVPAARRPRARHRRRARPRGRARLRARRWTAS